MIGRRLLMSLAMAVAAVTIARSGHELPVYPSYYPHEIMLVPVERERAGELLLAGKIQAHVGAAPRFEGTLPATIDSVESLGSFIVVRINPDSPLIKGGRPACAVAGAIVRSLAGKSEGFIVRPYPVTPFHGDYLNHVDLAEAAKARIFNRQGDELGRSQPPRIRANGDFARSLLRPDWLATGSRWDAELEEIDAAHLAAARRLSTNGWIAPAWLREGWFHAALLLFDESFGDEHKRRIQAVIERLQRADTETSVERINLERSLVENLTGDCHALVAGYTVKREYFSTAFTAGIENVSYDAIDGFNSPMFIRTVKLKDFPWNGWLTLGVATPPVAAWNPIAGFIDEFGRLMWSAVGDPASIPAPNSADWFFNRITSVQSSVKK